MQRIEAIEIKRAIHIEYEYMQKLIVLYQNIPLTFAVGDIFNFNYGNIKDNLSITKITKVINCEEFNFTYHIQFSTPYNTELPIHTILEGMDKGRIKKQS